VTKQLTVAGWPVYRYVGDKKPGTWRGQNVNGTWFVIKPTGAKNLTCLPAVSKPVPPPADDKAVAGQQAADNAGDDGQQAPDSAGDAGEQAPDSGDAGGPAVGY
jgi:hypothetical protein